ncbi:LysR substrate-binding domain-containing protein [Erwinia sp. V71]|uniref:LysR substrate-binding domain-containing protein n=1 Tax=Erwinia sp. V71 TaxID=3369424 RepID=UPI003F610A9A
MKRLPPLYALRAFEQAARYNSFTLAAEALSITPGAVSRHIKTLEADFACQLFVRKGTRVEITTAGERLALQLREGFRTIESACDAFQRHGGDLRLKAASTLTMRWLLDVLQRFHEENSSLRAQLTSVWMDIDQVDFQREPYDCAILLGNGHFGAGTQSALLFSEWLIPLCAPALASQAQTRLDQCELIHPSADRRDWRRWLKRSGYTPQLDIQRGKVFDSLEQGNMAAISGHGVSVGDLLLSQAAIRQGLLATPFPQAVSTGDGYYLVWPENSQRQRTIGLLHRFLLEYLPQNTLPGIAFLSSG